MPGYRRVSAPMRVLWKACCVTILLALPACATSFQGSSHISPAACNERCSSIGQRMAAYVFMGDYSTACVCEPMSSAHAAEGGSGSVGGAVAGVWMQMQAQRQQQMQR